MEDNRQGKRRAAGQAARNEADEERVSGRRCRDAVVMCIVLLRFKVLRDSHFKKIAKATAEQLAKAPEAPLSLQELAERKEAQEALATAEFDAAWKAFNVSLLR